MPETCRSCSFHEIDYGGRRRQAALITGDASVTDPACTLSPYREKLVSFVESMQTAQDGSPFFEKELGSLAFRQNP
jgi:pyrroloquinoline quinone biosynthesis protein E